MTSVLTPEYQKRLVQQNYHEGVSNAPQWMAAFCYPDGLMRWWSQAALGGPIEVIVTPTQVQFLAGVADNLTAQGPRRPRARSERRSRNGWARP